MIKDYANNQAVKRKDMLSTPQPREEYQENKYQKKDDQTKIP